MSNKTAGAHHAFQTCSPTTYAICTACIYVSLLQQGQGVRVFQRKLLEVTVKRHYHSVFFPECHVFPEAHCHCERI